jgi:glutamyl/glutaminyl-tRNA synthetase
MSVFAIQNFKIRGKTLPTYWNRTFLLLACQTQEKMSKSAGAASVKYLRESGKSKSDIWRLIGRLMGFKENIEGWQQLSQLIPPG